MAKLKIEDVIEIRRLYAADRTQAEIADRFGVSRGCVQKVLAGTRWKEDPCLAG